MNGRYVGKRLLTVGLREKEGRLILLQTYRKLVSFAAGQPKKQGMHPNMT